MITLNPQPGIDRTIEIQNLINKSKNEILYFSPGEYIIGALKINPSQVTLVTGPSQGNKYAIIKSRANGGVWQRNFTVAWGREGESPQIAFQNLIFNMNKNEQNWLGGHDLEHQAAIFAGTDRGRINLKVANCKFYDSVADSIYIHHNVGAKIDYCIMRDIYRGSPAITGNNSKVSINNIRCYSPTVPTGIDCEPNNGGHRFSLKLNQCLFGKFDLYTTNGTTVKAQNVTVEQGILYLYNDGSVYCKDCNFSINANYKMRFVGKSAIYEDCTFTATRNRRAGGARAMNLLGLSFVGRTTTDQINNLLTLKNCRFTTDETIQEEDTVAALISGKDAYPETNNNRVILDGCTIDGFFDVGIQLDNRAFLEASNTHINATRPIVTKTKSLLDNVTYGPRKTVA